MKGLTDWLTDWLTVTQLLNKVPSFSGTQRFITVFTDALCNILKQAGILQWRTVSLLPNPPAGEPFNNMKGLSYIIKGNLWSD
jgi:hypothetical protein